MRLNESLLSDCEEFFEQVAFGDDCADLSEAIESLREVLVRDVDGWTNFSDERLARLVQCRLSDIWGQIPKTQRNANPDLKEYYGNIIEQLEELSGFETDECEEDDL